MINKKPLKKIAIYLCGGLALLPFCIFNITPFPIVNIGTENYGDPCYSPNKEYYIKRYTTLPKALYVIPSHSKEGLAILFDRTGKELYRGVAYDIYKPGWSGNTVGFFGKWGDQWSVNLPTDSGEFIGCSS
jgi:hypothetical protein